MHSVCSAPVLCTTSSSYCLICALSAVHRATLASWGPPVSLVGHPPRLHATLPLRPTLPPLLLLGGAGRGYMDVNRISGYIPGKLVFFLLQVGGRVGVCG